MTALTEASRATPPTDRRASGLLFDDVSVRIPLPGTPRRWVHAARGLRLHAPAGQVTAVVGESGCGKSVLALAAMGLLPSGTRTAGAIAFADLDLLAPDEAVLATVRGSRVGLVPQSPITHLTPVRTVGSQLAETLRTHGHPAATSDVGDLLGRVGLDVDDQRRYPHELSGGMAQRAQVALTLALEPDVVLADEPTSALDAASAEVVLDLLAARARQGAAVVLVTHDLRAARRVADRVAVMYAGELLEVGPASEVLDHPRHDYSAALLAALPENGLRPPPGSPSSLVDPPEGRCAWHHRVGRECHHQPLAEVTPGTWVACTEPERTR